MVLVSGASERDRRGRCRISYSTGGRAVPASCSRRWAPSTTFRPAEPGEFYAGAFENGKLDLTEAEGLDDSIHADTDRQRRQALRQLEGTAWRQGGNWRQQIIEALALVEAASIFLTRATNPPELPALAWR